MYIHNHRTGAELGVAWVGALCTTDVQEQRTGGQTQYVSGTGVSSVGNYINKI